MEKGGRRRELFEPQRQERQISGVVTTLSDKINELQNGTEQKEESQKAFPLACRFYANTSHRENSYCQQIHDGVTGLSKQGFSEADAEQRTWVDCKRKKCSFTDDSKEIPSHASVQHNSKWL